MTNLLVREQQQVLRLTLMRFFSLLSLVARSGERFVRGERSLFRHLLNSCSLDFDRNHRHWV
jgi:hypothetical protein